MPIAAEDFATDGSSLPPAGSADPAPPPPVIGPPMPYAGAPAWTPAMNPWHGAPQWWWASQVQGPPPPRKPPLWTAFTIVICSVPATLAAGLVMGVVLALSLMSSLTPAGEGSEEVMDVLSSPRGLVWMVIVPGQAIFALAAVLGVLVDRQRFAAAIGWRRPKVSWIWLPVAALSALPVSVVVQFLIYQLTKALGIEEDMLEKALMGGSGSELWLLMGALSLLPGLIEESLFRGYLQRRLLIHWSAWAAIPVSAACFAVAHVLPVQVVAVFPLGIWMGIIAWRTGSIWFSMACHAVYNLFGVSCVRFLTWDTMFRADNVPMVLGFVGITSIAAIAFGAALVRAKPGPIEYRDRRRPPRRLEAVVAGTAAAI